MKEPNNKLPRYLIGAASIVFIIYMWIEKDIASIYATMPADQVTPLIITTVVVSLAKVGAITGVILLAKWLIEQFTRKKD